MGAYGNAPLLSKWTDRPQPNSRDGSSALWLFAGACVMTVVLLVAQGVHQGASSAQLHSTTQTVGQTHALTQLAGNPALPAAEPSKAGANAKPAPAGVPAADWIQPQTSAAMGHISIPSLVAAAASAMLLVASFLLGQRSQPRIAMASTSGQINKEEARSQMRQLVSELDAADMRTLSRGASMVDVARSKGIDEVALAIRAEQQTRKDLSPKDVILEMQRGNGRFWMGLSTRPEMNAMERRALIMAQAPKICVLSCADSRVPIEIILDQGLGEVFVVRTAGNILDTNAHGSIEFAVKYLGVKVLMVVGHEACGAVKGAISMSQEDIAKEPFDLQNVLKSIKSNLDVNALNKISDTRSRDREAIVENTLVQVKELQQNALIAGKVEDGQLMVCGAFYEISSGIVDLFSLDKNGFLVDV